jgi:hypothetical protein
MPEAHEFDYQAAIDRLLHDFQPVKRLWPVGLRLLCWILFDATVAVLAARLSGAPLADTVRGADFYSSAIFGLAGVGAAWLALRSVVPGREPSFRELRTLLVGFSAATLIVPFAASASFRLFAGLDADLSSTWRWLGLAIVPWLGLLWAAWRGVPVRPGRTGALIGVAAACIALASDGLLFGDAASASATGVALFGAITIVWSTAAGAMWLNPARWWQQHFRARGPRPSAAVRFDTQWLMPLGLAASVLIMVFSLRANFAPEPNFDLAIASYDRSLRNFHPNVPSTTIDSVLIAYIESGMPAYMWDFGSQGFKLAGGRIERLSDGTPVAYTWFRGSRNGVICLLRKVAAFIPPAATNQERDRMLFYRYKGFSVCMINVGGYGNFVSVIVAPMPMKDFIALVSTATK